MNRITPYKNKAFSFASVVLLSGLSVALSTSAAQAVGLYQAVFTDTISSVEGQIECGSLLVRAIGKQSGRTSV
jgi:hypothetical protein